MAKIPDNYISQLKEAGLFVSDPWPTNHVMANHVVIGKPIEVEGNKIQGFETSYGLEGTQKFDAPLVRFYFDGELWIVRAIDHSPTPGPGDFMNEWKSAEEAVKDILDFFLGDPQRMNKKAKRKAEVRARIKEYKGKK